jgi:3-oxoacyl-[acyl-carrier-protein] synthase-3
MGDAYIASMGKFLPGDPVPIDEIDDHIGALGEGVTKLRDRVVANSGIQTRHYALGRDQESRYSAAGMAAEAIADALARIGLDPNELDLIAAASSGPDLLAPGLASMVHGELGTGPCETVTHSGVCCSGAQALKNAYLHVKHDGKKNAVACAVEFTSRFLKKSWVSYSRERGGAPVTLDGAFLRYILSDGAGAALVRDEPGPGATNLRIDWISQRSYANAGPPVMYCGTDKPESTKSWLDYADPEEAALHGALAFRQDLRRLPEVVRVCVDEHDRLVNEGMFEPGKVRFVAAHYSSEIMKRAALREFASRGGRYVPGDRWRSNLATVGNVGAAAIYLILEELLAEGELEDGDQVLCMVPESGRYSISYMLMSAVRVQQPAAASATEPAVSTAG